MDNINPDWLQYSPYAINTTIDILSNVAIKSGPKSNTPTKQRRRKLNGWNVFTKCKSLERVLGHQSTVLFCVSPSSSKQRSIYREFLRDT